MQVFFWEAVKYMKIDGLGTQGYTVDKAAETMNKAVQGKSLSDAVSFGSSVMGFLGESTGNFSILGNAPQTIEALKEQATILKDNLNAVFNKMDTGTIVKMDEDGVDINNTDSKELVTVVEQIQIKLAMYCNDFEATVDIDAEAVTEVLGQGAVAYSISEKLSQKGITPTKENVSEVMDALDTVSKLEKKPSDGTKAYLLKNGISPSIQNMYIAGHAGTANCTGKELTAGEWEDIKLQVDKIITKSGLELNEKNSQNGKWLVEHNIPVTEENLIKLSDMDKIENELTTDKIVDRIIATVIEGQSAVSTLVTGEKLPWEETAAAIKTLETVGPGNIMAWVYSGREYNLEGLKETLELREEAQPDYRDAGFIRASRELQEIRLMMTIEAGRMLERSGIDINTTEISRLVEELRKTELEICNRNITDKSAAYAPEELKEANRAVLSFMNLKTAPSAVLGSVIKSKEGVNAVNLAAHAPSIHNSYVKAGEAYEALSTEIRRDLGDNISKAVKASTETLLSDMGYENNDANKRAVRILAYNEMEITAENIDKVKLMDISVNTLFDRLTPEKALNMIREGINPLETEVDILSEYLLAQDALSRPKEEKYSEFLYRLDKKGDISPEEREKFIGIYALAHKFQKDDLNVIGSLINQGLELNMGNLLTAFYSSRDKGMELAADDESVVVKGKDKVSYYKNLFAKAADKITPDKLEKLGDNIDTMSVEAFTDNIIEDTLEDAYPYEKIIENFREAANLPDEVYKFITSNNIPAFLNNILSAKEFLRDEDKTFRDYEKLSGDGEYPDKILASLDNKDELLKEYENIAAETKELIEKATYTETSYIDMETLRMFGNRVNLVQTLARQNHFCIPYKEDGKKGVIHLKVSEGGNEKGIFNIAFHSLSGGKITVEGKVRADGIKASIMCSDGSDTQQYKNKTNIIREELLAKGFEDVRISVNDVKEQPEGNIKVMENVSTANIFRAAKIFIVNLTNQ